MRLRYQLPLFLCLLVLNYASFSQSPRSIVRTPYSKEDQRDFLLDQSQKLRTEAIVASATGPLMAGVGFYLLSKESSITLSGSGGWMSVRENNSPNRVYGSILAGVGCLTTISILPLFINSAKAKKKANLILSDQSTSFLHSRIPVPSLGLQINF